MRSILSFLILFLLASSFVYAKESVVPLITGGGYQVQNSDEKLPLIAMSQDQGKNWTYKNVNNSKLTDATIEATACNQTFCVAAGTYWWLAWYKYPYFISSNNQGKSWQTTRPPILVKDMTMEKINAVCSSQFCLVSINYIDYQRRNRTLLAVSHDGSSWFYPNSIQSLENVAITAASCTDTMCTIAGVQRDEKGDYALIVTSKDNGTTWMLEKTPYLSCPGCSYKIVDIKCKQNNTCIAVGDYYDRGFRVISLRKAQGDSSWSLAPIVPISQSYSTNTDTLAVNNISTTKNTWLISGTGQLPSSQLKCPIGLISQDDGITWSQSSSLQSNIPDQVKNNDLFGGPISCIGSHCIMNTYTYAHDFLATSSDEGMNWSYMDIKNALPTDINSVGTHKLNISCSNGTCIITGAYYSGEMNIRKPLVIVSHNEGKTWYSPESTYQSTSLPENFYTGYFIAQSNLLKKNFR